MYYLEPDLSSFNFTPAVETFLREIDVGPRALCLIDVTRDFESNSWMENFRRAGLSEEHAAILQTLFVDSLSNEQGFILLAAADDEPQGLFTRRATRGSVAASESSVTTESSLGEDD